MNQDCFENVKENRADGRAVQEALYPLAFSGAKRSGAVDLYLSNPAVRRLVEFFESKGLPTLKEEDRREQWYDDWLAYQATHQLYARLLTPRAYARLGTGFDLLRYVRFLEVFAYFSPAHGYSLQVTFLGLCAILMGTKPALKREAVAALEAGELLAFGISEQGHGSDLLGTEFTVSEHRPGLLVANGAKYYIGNANCASIIAILARKEDRRSDAHARRAPPVLFAMRPSRSQAFRNVQKISTMGVRAAFVGEFEVRNHELSEDDLIAEGRQAWDAVFGTVTVGKFFLGFGSIGICEHAFREADDHLRKRLLYGKPVIEMPHIRATMVQANVRLTAMKLYAYRALDYAQAASDADRRFLLFAAVQKAKVSTEGVKVAALLSECLGARGFEAETYFEMALRDVQLIPGLEGSTHINLGLTAQFVPAYFAPFGAKLEEPGSVVAGDVPREENPYLTEIRSGAIHKVTFPHFLRAYGPLMSVANVRLFVKQAKAFELFVRDHPLDRRARADTPLTLATGRCLATIAYAQLIAESAVRFRVPAPIVRVMFHALVNDFSQAALMLASCCVSGAMNRVLLNHLVSVPRIADEDYDFISEHMAGTGDPHRWSA